LVAIFFWGDISIPSEFRGTRKTERALFKGLPGLVRVTMRM